MTVRQLAAVLLDALLFIHLGTSSAVAAEKNIASLPPDQFVNPIAEGADPWVVRDPAKKGTRYLWCLSEGNRAIAVHSSEHLTSLGTKHIVWRAPKEGPFSREVWAPELHFLKDRWHIYFAASNGRNENHLAYVLESKTEDPLGEYRLKGPFATGEGEDGRAPNIWAIDMTPLEHGGKLYALWSGWDAPGTDRQYLYIAPMKSPTELAGRRVRLCANDTFPWEFTEGDGKGRGLNEGPQVLESHGRIFVTFSCGGSWLPTYKLGLLELTGDDPLDPKAWAKMARPVFQGTKDTYGVGHSCFVKSPDGREWWHIFHAKRDRRPGWRRSIYVQPMSFNENGLPQFGKPVAAGTALKRPGGEVRSSRKLPFKCSLREQDDQLDGWSFFGHHQYFRHGESGLHLGRVPDDPINAYRSGEKLVLDGTLPRDFTAAVTIDFRGDAQARDAGLLFRTSGPSVGYDAQRGYFAGLIPRTGLVILGRTDGRKWAELARAKAAIDPARPHRLGVRARGERIEVLLDAKVFLIKSDSTYGSGAIGLRVVDTHAVFRDLEVEEEPASDE